ncbi:MAG: hypothetical protein K0Q58_1179, partial [Microbacterium sp.]|nr:hypothetical protein [Microbacterium sp.]
MWGNVLRSVLLCGVLATGTPAVPADVIDPYTPVTPRESSLAGSEVSSGCREGAPVIDYSVTVTDPTAADPAAPASATLTMSNAASSLDVPLGMVRDGRLEGSVPWPAPSWTHDGVATVLRVGGLTLSVPLDRPMTAEDCGTGVPASGGRGAGVRGVDGVHRVRGVHRVCRIRGVRAGGHRIRDAADRGRRRGIRSARWRSPVRTRATPRPPHRRPLMRAKAPRRLIVAGAAAALSLAVLATAYVGMRAVQAREDLMAAAAAADTAAAALELGHLDAASDALAVMTARASAVDVGGDPLWRAAEAVPGIGPNLTAARVSASGLSRLGRDVAMPLLEVSRDLQGADSMQLVEVLSGAADTLRRADEVRADVEAELSELDRDTLLGPVAT